MIKVKHFKTVVILGPRIDDESMDIVKKVFRPKSLLEIIKEAEAAENRIRNAPVEVFVPEDQEHYDNFKIPGLEKSIKK